MLNVFKNQILILLLIFTIAACGPKTPSIVTASSVPATPAYTPIPSPTWTPDPREQYQPPSVALCTELATWDQTYDINVDLGGDNDEVFSPGYITGYNSQEILDDQANATIDLVYCSLTVVNAEITAVTPCGGMTGVVCPITCGGSNDPSCI